MILGASLCGTTTKANYRIWDHGIDHSSILYATYMLHGDLRRRDHPTREFKLTTAILGIWDHTAVANFSSLYYIYMYIYVYTYFLS